MNKEEQGAGELYLRLIEQLKCEPNFVSDDGELKKWVVAEAARAYSADVISLLLKDEVLRNAFFVNVNGTEVFKLDKFLLFVEQKNYLNDGYTQFSQKVGLKIGGKFLNQRSEVELVFPHKDCVLEGGQTKEDQKRQEIFFNEVLAQDEITQLLEPKVLTGGKRYDSEGEHPLDGFVRDAEINEKRGLPKDTITDNLIVKGNNLLALHTLKREFAGKVKLIYIDPPFNTGNDSFGYNDSFNHSTWLTFMKNRLDISRELLKENGIIFIECDKNEAAYLKVLCDSIFNIKNFVSDIAVQTSYANGLKVSQKEKTILKMKDTILVYKKGDLSFKPQYIEKHYWDTHYNQLLYKTKDGELKFKSLKDELVKQGILEPNETISKKTIDKPLFYAYVCEHKDNICCLNPIHSDGEIKKIAQESNGRIIKYVSSKGNTQYLYNGRSVGFFNQCFHLVNGEEKLSVLLGDIWTDIDFGNNQNEGGIDFPNGKKPEQLLSRIIDMVTNENDIVLDFYLGSGTTSAVAHKLKRQYIGIEQMDYIHDLAEKRLQLVLNGERSGISKAVGWRGGGSFVYLELKKYNQVFIDEIESATKTDELLAIWEKMKQKAFFRFNVDMQKFDEGIEDFMALTLKQQKECLCKMLDLNQLYVNRSDMEDETAKVTEEEKRITKNFYQEA